MQGEGLGIFCSLNDVPRTRERAEWDNGKNNMS